MAAGAPNSGRRQWRPKTGAPPPSARGSGASAAHGAAAAPDGLTSPMLRRPGSIGRLPAQGTGRRWAHTPNGGAPPPNARGGGATAHSAAAAGSAQLLLLLLLLQTCPRPVPASQLLWWRQNESSRSPPVHRGGGWGGALFNEECRRRRRAAAGRLNQPLCVSLILRLEMPFRLSTARTVLRWSS